MKLLARPSTASLHLQSPSLWVWRCAPPHKGDSQDDADVRFCIKYVSMRDSQLGQCNMNRRRTPMGVFFYFLAALMLGFYFTFAAVQGDFGVFKRAEINAERRALTEELAALKVQVGKLENLTRRLSDDYLDLDLLDEQARDMLGMVRTDEIVIR
jgi:cell division protein FtsB